MTPVGWLAVGFCLPFALTTALIAGLAGRYAWERRRDDRRDKAFREGLAGVRRRIAEHIDDNLAHLPDSEDFAAWENELGSEVDR